MEQISKDEILDRVEHYTWMINYMRDQISESQYVISHPDEYDDLVVACHRSHIGSYKYDLACYQTYRRSLCEKYPDIIPLSYHYDALN